MYVLNLNIVVEQPEQTITFPAVASLRVRRSIHSFIDAGIIRLPITSRIERIDSKLITPGTDTAKVFNRGDQIEVFAGHDGVLRSEFKGFIKNINFTDPCELILEGYAFQLRKKAPVKSWKSVSMKELLGVLIEGTDITIHPDTPDTTLAPYYIGTKGEDAIDVLEDLKKKRILTVYFINGNELYVGPEETALRDEEVGHDLGWNTIDEDKLKYRRLEDVKVHCSVEYTDSKGKRRHTSVGERGGIEKNMLITHAITADEAKRLATISAEQFLYEGYEGAIKTLLEPFCQPGWKSNVTDRTYGERAGGFIIEGTTLEIDPAPQGDVRTVEIGKKVNRQR